jgi:hypothetical protein
MRTAGLSAEHPQLVAERQDLDVLGAVIRRACDKAGDRAGDQGEEEQHPRVLRIGELEGESGFPTPTPFKRGPGRPRRSESGNGVAESGSIHTRYTRSRR